jgi:hypothetical protein
MRGFAAALWPAFGGRKPLIQNTFTSVNINEGDETNLFDESRADEPHTIPTVYGDPKGL